MGSPAGLPASEGLCVTSSGASGAAGLQGVAINGIGARGREGHFMPFTPVWLSLGRNVVGVGTADVQVCDRLNESKDRGLSKF